MCCWNAARCDARLRADEHGEHVPRGVDLGRGARAARTRRAAARTAAVSRSKLRLRRARLSGSLSSCTRPNAAESSDGLEVPADLVEDEEVVVFEVAVDRREEAPVDALARAVDLRLRAAAPAAQEQAAVDELVVVEAHHAAGAGRGDDVREREARDGDVGAGAGRRAAQRRAERVARVLDRPAARARRRWRGCGPSRARCR